MPEGRRVPLSGLNLSLDQIDRQYRITTDALRLWFEDRSRRAVPRPGRPTLHAGAVLEEVLIEHDRLASMQVLASLEAAFRIDYLVRGRERGRDPLSRSLREVYREKGRRASYEDDILATWKAFTLGGGRLFGDVVSAQRYRHWLAHGRYWTPKLGRDYDYAAIALLARTVFGSLPLRGDA